MPIKRDTILEYHRSGKIALHLTKPLRGPDDLSLAYTPGVAEAVLEIHRHPETLGAYTAKRNLVAVATDGTAILGLGDLGAAASIPVMEGKAVLFKALGDVDGWPMPLGRCRMGGADTGKTDPQRVIDAVAAMAPLYGGINLEDIAAPACFEIENKLDAMLDIPVFHDDQWGTAVIVLAAAINYAHLSERRLEDLRIVVNGAGAAGIRITEMLKTAGAVSVTLCDSKGVIRTSRTDLSGKKREHAVATQARTVGDALRGAHLFIGVSVADCLTADDVRGMAAFPAIFAMANPCPEISPEAVAAALGDRHCVMATGRSDYPNQINNVLGFPYIFRGALDVGAHTVNLAMKQAAAQALAALARETVPDAVKRIYHAPDLEFGTRMVIPKPFDRRLFVNVSLAVVQAAMTSGAAPSGFDLTAYRVALAARDRDRFFVAE